MMSLALVAWCLLGVWLLEVDASSLLSSSSLEVCSVSAADGSDLDCKNKIVATLSIGSGQNDATEFLEAELVSTRDDASGETRVLEEPYKISVTKTPVVVTYPLYYVQTFNSHPTEQVVYVSGSCSAGGNAEQPTCGWFLNGDGQRVENSQGFCCECSTADVIDSTLGDGGEEVTRGDLDCNWFGNGGANIVEGTQESGHCLRFDPLWYLGFGIKESQLVFRITVTVTKASGSSEGQGATETPSVTPGKDTGVETLVLSPSVPLMVNSAGTVLVRLEGDFMPYEAIPVYSEKMLMVPDSPEGLADQTQWMMVDKNRVTLDGSECNKIGTSFEAFKVRQVDACRQQVDSCLKNQLVDFVEADAARAAAGRTGDYMLDNFGDLYPARVQNAETGEVESALAFNARPTLNSVVVLELSADSMRLIVHRAAGAIVTVTVGDFESSSRDGKMVVLIRNTGELAAEFTVIVSKCTDLVALVNSLSRTIVAGADEQFTFALRAETTHSAAHTCTVSLVDSQGEVLHSVLASFMTNETQQEFGGQEGTVDRDVRGISADSSRNGSGGGACTTICEGLWDVVCLIVLGCWSLLGQLILYIFLILALIGLAVWLATSGVLVRACGSSKTDSDSPRKKRRGQRDYASEEDSESDQDKRRRSKVRQRRRSSPARHPSRRRSEYGSDDNDNDGRSSSLEYDRQRLGGVVVVHEGGAHPSPEVLPLRDERHAFR